MNTATQLGAGTVKFDTGYDGKHVRSVTAILLSEVQYMGNETTTDVMGSLCTLPCSPCRNEKRAGWCRVHGTRRSLKDLQICMERSRGEEGRSYVRVTHMGSRQIYKKHMQKGSMLIVVSSFTRSFPYEQKTFNSGYSLVVTHLTTNPPVRCLNRAERTGSLALNVLWSNVK
jgi:hypothetical protein